MMDNVRWKEIRLDFDTYQEEKAQEFERGLQEGAAFVMKDLAALIEAGEKLGDFDEASEASRFAMEFKLGKEVRDLVLTILKSRRYLNGK